MTVEHGRAEGLRRAYEEEQLVEIVFILAMQCLLGVHSSGG